MPQKGQITKHEWWYWRRTMNGVLYKCYACPCVKSVIEYPNGTETTYRSKIHDSPVTEEPPCITRNPEQEATNTLHVSAKRSTRPPGTQDE